MNTFRFQARKRENLNTSKIQTADKPFEVPLKDPSTVSGEVEAVFKNLERRLMEKIRQHDFVFGCVAWLTHTEILETLATRRGVSLVVQKEDFLRPDGPTNSSDFKTRLHETYSRLPGFNERFALNLPGGLIEQLSVGGDPTLEAVRCCGILAANKNEIVPRCHHKFVIFADSRVALDGELPSDEELSKELAMLQEQERNYVPGSGGLWAGIEAVRFKSPASIEALRERYSAERRSIQPKAVWTGSFNFTENAVNSFENAVIISDPVIVNAYVCEYEQIVALSEPLDWMHEYVAPEWRIGT